MDVRSGIVLLVSGAFACAPIHTPSRPAVERPTERWGTERPRDAPDVHLVLKLGERRLYVMEAQGPVESFPVAVGSPEYRTPIGRFQVDHMRMNPSFTTFDWKDPSKVTGVLPPGPDNPLGLRWIGFTSFHGWDIGFHGTPHPELLGQAVTHGCVRLHNRDVVALYDRVRVGTTVIVQP